jgi:hypothetical protein
MTQTLVTAIELINALSFEEKHQLWLILEEAIAETEQNWNQDDETKLEIQKVRDEYDKGEYLTFDRYLLQKRS